jgi:hypothetical protein
MKKILWVLTLSCGLAAAGEFTPYPGATQLPEPRNNPKHLTSYSSKDSYAKVVDFYRKGNKVKDDMPGVAEIHFDGGDGMLVRDAGPQGIIIVYDPRKK